MRRNRSRLRYAAILLTSATPLACTDDGAGSDTDTTPGTTAADDGGPGPGTTPEPSTSSPDPSTSVGPGDDSSAGTSGPETGSESTAVGESTAGSESTAVGESTEGNTDSTGSSSSEGGSDSGGVVNADVTVTWTNFTMTPGCFLLNEPGIIGNSATWDQNGDDVVLTFPSVNGRFGDYDPIYSGAQAGDTVELVGMFTFDFGFVYDVTETFTGEFDGVTYTGSWAYEECDVATPDECPGFCTGSADFEIVLQK